MPEEWMVDASGRKYRVISPGCIEYIPTITIDGMEVENTQEALKAFHARKKAAIERLRAEEQNQQQQEQTFKICPLNRYSRFPVRCKTSCAFYRDTGCTRKRMEAITDTAGKSCPYMRKCTSECALYDHGCTI